MAAAKLHLLHADLVNTLQAAAEAQRPLEQRRARRPCFIAARNDTICYMTAVHGVKFHAMPQIHLYPVPGILAPKGTLILLYSTKLLLDGEVTERILLRYSIPVAPSLSSRKRIFQAPTPAKPSQAGKCTTTVGGEVDRRYVPAIRLKFLESFQEPAACLEAQLEGVVAILWASCAAMTAAASATPKCQAQTSPCSSQLGDSQAPDLP
jgi:hypothetical protein